MEKIIEATTNRLIKSLHQRISKIEKTLAAVDSMMDVASTETSDDSMADSDNEIHVINVQHNVQQHATQKTATSATSNSTPQQHTTSNDIKKKHQTRRKQHRKHEIFNETTGENEIVAIEIPTKSLFKSIIIASIYIPPKTRICCDIFHKFHKLNNNVMIVGDLNAALQHMGSRKTNAKGRQLQDLLEEEKIDWILTSQPLLSFISNVETHPTIGSTSGHKPLTLEISIGVEHKPTSPRTSFNFKAANWIKFRKILSDQLQLWNQSRTINTTVKIEEYNMFITNSLLEATQAAIPKLKQATSSYTISEATRSLIKTKHQHYRRWKKNGQETDKQLYYKYKLLLTNSLRNDRKDHYKKLMSSLCQKKMYSESVWLTVRKFHQKRIKQSLPRIMNYNNIVATSEKEKANIFAEFFQSEIYAAPNNTLPFHDQVSNRVNIIRNRMQNTADIKWNKITPEEVKWHMKQLRNSATGSDNIHNRCLKNYTSQLIDHLTLLFNSIVDVGYIPSVWKKANIILLLKPNKDKHQPSSYRPISPLSCLGKLLERIIKQRLLLELNSRNILPQHQAGFRPKKSTMYNIIRIERYVKSQLHHPKIRRHTAAIFFDIKAAFDSVCHEGLIYKFNDLRFPTYIIKYLISFLESRTATVELDNT
ncbi:unnamed protein product [Rotaria magnacalcarata]|nr:unnamed protein product [Rotaria magnacalcarata]